jgi:hypothetical protein
VRKIGSKGWQIQIPLRCQNLAGAVEVVLRAGSGRGEIARPDRLSDATGSDHEVRQLTGCTSPKTTVTLILADTEVRQKPGVTLDRRLRARCVGLSARPRRCP